MTATLGWSVELLERALGYTRARLARVDDVLLDRLTPCAGWTLGDLLAHMEDALDAFTEAAGGEVELHGGCPAEGRVEGRVAAIQQKACALLGAWGGPSPGDVVIAASSGGLDLMSTVLVSTAALEVTVHGWDVGRATGESAGIPAALARDLLPVAQRVVRPEDRGVRFAAARAVAADAPYDVRLLAHVGRT
ncbi:MAG TPA: TIGR03086 family metal-binding protein [Nocardioides sp.]|nr:TIGR03086 family metal-binding protein [Nocardioides sp.]